MDEVRGKKLAIGMGVVTVIILLAAYGSTLDRGKLTPEQRLAIEADCHEHPQALRCH